MSPRADEVKFISHHAFGLIAGSTLAAIAIVALTLVLLLLVDAAALPPARAVARRPARSSSTAGIAFAVVSLGHQIVGAIETHKFAVGHDFSNHAVDQALTKGTLNMIVVYLALISALALAGGTIVVSMNAQRVGLIPRWMGILGIFTGVLIFLPIGGAQLQIVPAFWLVMMGVLFSGRWSKGDPPAWAAGEARPWPSAAQARAEREGGGQAGSRATAGGRLPGRRRTSRPHRPSRRSRAPRANGGASARRVAEPRVSARDGEEAEAEGEELDRELAGLLEVETLRALAGVPRRRHC